MVLMSDTNAGAAPAPEAPQALPIQPRPDFTRASKLTQDVALAVEDAFDYHPWDEEKTKRGADVRHALASAVQVIITNVPPCPDRSAAIRKIREARMDCNSAITHDGRY
jgi:hypothetical protein